MKTDKEFLEGIYIKAEQILQEERNDKSNKALKTKINWKQAKIAFVLCLLALIILPISRYQLFWHTEGKKEVEKEPMIQRIGDAEENVTSDKNNMDEDNIDENAELSNDSAAYSLEIDSDKEKSIASSNSYLVSGIVTKTETIEENQVEITIQVLHTYQGTAKSEITFLCFKESLWFDIEKEEKELLFYLKETDSVYELSNGDYSLYRMLKEENNEKIYETKDGSTISSDIIEQNDNKSKENKR